MTKRFGMPTHYQSQVNSLTGALGPKQPAFWKNTYKLTGPAYSLASQPLYYAPSKGFYVTSADVPAANYSVNFSNFDSENLEEVVVVVEAEEVVVEANAEAVEAEEVVVEANAEAEDHQKKSG